MDKLGLQTLCCAVQALRLSDETCCMLADISVPWQLVLQALGWLLHA